MHLLALIVRFRFINFFGKGGRNSRKKSLPNFWIYFQAEKFSRAVVRNLKRGKMIEKDQRVCNWYMTNPSLMCYAKRGRKMTKKVFEKKIIIEASSLRERIYSLKTENLLSKFEICLMRTWQRLSNVEIFKHVDDEM